MFAIFAQLGSHTDRAIGETISTTGGSLAWWGGLAQNTALLVIGLLVLLIVGGLIAGLRSLVVTKVSAGELGILETWGKGTVETIREPGQLVWTLPPFKMTVRVVNTQSRLTKAHLHGDKKITVQTKSGATVTASYIVRWRIGVGPSRIFAVREDF